MRDDGKERQRLCGGLFGCGGDNESEYMVEPDAVDAALTPRTRDRLDRMDELNQEALEPYVASYRVSRRRVVGAGGLLGLLATLAPTSLLTACSALRPGRMGATPGGRTHVVESNTETVRLGVFDATRPNVVEIDSGDTVVYPNTWTHFLNRFQRGVTIQQLAQWRVENPGKGPHSIIGPVGVKGAKPGDMLAIRFLTITPLDWGANLNNPGALKTGALPDEFPDGQIKFLDIDVQRKLVKFSPSITLPVAPFQGTFGVAAPEDREVVGRVSPGVVSSVAPGQHAGNMDLKELQEGTVLYIPVWQDLHRRLPRASGRRRGQSDRPRDRHARGACPGSPSGEGGLAVAVCGKRHALDRHRRASRSERGVSHLAPQHDRLPEPPCRPDPS